MFEESKSLQPQRLVFLAWPCPDFGDNGLRHEERALFHLRGRDCAVAARTPRRAAEGGRCDGARLCTRMRVVV